MYYEPFYTPLRPKFKLTRREIIQILIAWLGITFAFSWRTNFQLMLKILPIVLIGTLTGFIFHELAHKFTAIHYGAYAEFIMWPTGLIFAIFLSLLTGGSFVFAAPGAVYIFGPHLTRRQNGIISLAGPLANLFVAIILILISLLVPWQYPAFVLINAALINIFLGGFNMLPIPPLDGSKVFVWNKGIWAALFVIFILMWFALGL